MTYPDSTADFPEWDRETPIEIYKWAREIHQQRARASRSSMLALRDERDRPLYRVTCSGNLARNFKVRPEVRKRVLERDGEKCVWCGSTRELEIDHIVRYADGGSNEPDNLRTLCHRCHVKRGKGDL